MNPNSPLNKRSLLVRDGTAFVILCAVTVALFGITLFLFRSFEQHRLELGRRWSGRGRMALQSGQPEVAVISLRTALSYDPKERDDQLMLAQALAEAGRTDEAANYFLNLWETSPGDGFVNLQLARLERKKGNAQEASNYYRASIFGNWEGDGVRRRREVRLELAEYLAERGDRMAARAEILIAAGNAPEQEDLEISFGDRLLAISDPKDALDLYEKAVELNRHSAPALEKAGRVAYALGDYTKAHRFFSAVLQQPQAGHVQDQAAIATLAENSHRLQELDLSRNLTAAERAEHIMLASVIARKRLDVCSLQVGQSGKDGASVRPVAPVSPAIAALKARWAGATKKLNRPALEKELIVEDDVTQLIEDTELQTADLCGAPDGDNALLLLLARSRPGASR